MHLPSAPKICLKLNQTSSRFVIGLLIGLYCFLFQAANNFIIFSASPRSLFYLLYCVVFPSFILTLLYRVFRSSLTERCNNQLTAIAALLIFYLILIETLRAIPLGYHLFIIALYAYLFLIKNVSLNLLARFFGILIIVASAEFVSAWHKVAHARFDWIQTNPGFEQSSIRRPMNVYLIQPDGYVNSREFTRHGSIFASADIARWLAQNGFTNYPEFRSNYGDTISSNLALFTSSHHFYKDHTVYGEIPHARKLIAGKNAVHSFFKRNNYETLLLNATDYLTLEGCYYDFCLVHSRGWFPGITQFLSPGELQEWSEKVKSVIQTKTGRPRFVFIENATSPSHIAFRPQDSRGKEGEIEAYLTRVHHANHWIREVVETITTNDPSALIIVAADHGAYLGFESVISATSDELTPDLIHGCFASLLAIRWPGSADATITQDINSVINLFPHILSYLTGDRAFLDHRSDDSSFLVRAEPSLSVYRMINHDGKVEVSLHRNHEGL